MLHIEKETETHFLNNQNHVGLTLAVPILPEERKLTYIFIFTLLCGATKSFMKVSQAFVKPFAATIQKSLKIKI